MLQIIFALPSLFIHLCCLLCIRMLLSMMDVESLPFSDAAFVYTRLLGVASVLCSTYSTVATRLSSWLS